MFIKMIMKCVGMYGIKSTSLVCPRVLQNILLTYQVIHFVQFRLLVRAVEEIISVVGCLHSNTGDV